MTVWVVVVTHNGEHWLKTCLNSLANHQVIVIDNASTDHTPEILTPFPHIRLSKNLGFGRANNIGIRHALDNGADYVFLLNQDAWVAPDAIETLVAQAEQNPAFGLLSPVHLLASGIAVEAGFSSEILNQGNKDFFSDLYMGKTQVVYSVERVNAAAWLLSSACLREVGGFDPLFFMYGEDFDLCNRVLHHGWKIGVVPSAVIFHDKVYRKHPGWSGIPRRSQRLYADFLFPLKQPQRRLVINLAFWGLDIGYAVLKAIIDRNLPEFFALWMALITTLWRLPQITQHYARCRRKGAHWL